MTKASASVFAVSGSEDFLRERDLERIIEEHRGGGWRIDRIDGSSSGDLRAALSQRSLSFVDDAPPTLVVVESGDKADVELLEGHAKGQGSGIVVLLRHVGDPRENTHIGKFLKGLGKRHRNWPKPKDWDADKTAAEFVVKEFRAVGKAIQPRLAEIFVARVGPDLGFLSFEISKIAAAADAVPTTDIDADLVKRAMAPLAEAAAQPIADALGRKDARALSGHLDKLRKTAKDDQTIRVVRILFDAASKWLAVAEFRDRGIGDEAAAAELGVNPWFWRNRIVPQAGAWTRRGAAGLISALGDAERAVLSGRTNPWASLVASLLAACAGDGR